MRRVTLDKDDVVFGCREEMGLGIRERRMQDIRAA